jgi:hypothetical protein
LDFNTVNNILQWVVPSVIALYAGLKAKQAHREVKSPNGATTGDAVQELKKSMNTLEECMDYHIKSEDTKFALITKLLLRKDDE